METKPTKINSNNDLSNTKKEVDANLILNKVTSSLTIVKEDLYDIIQQSVIVLNDSKYDISKDAKSKLQNILKKMSGAQKRTDNSISNLSNLLKQSNPNSKITEDYEAKNTLDKQQEENDKKLEEYEVHRSFDLGNRKIDIVLLNDGKWAILENKHKIWDIRFRNYTNPLYKEHASFAIRIVNMKKERTILIDNIEWPAEFDDILYVNACDNFIYFAVVGRKLNLTESFNPKTHDIKKQREYYYGLQISKKIYWINKENEVVNKVYDLSIIKRDGTLFAVVKYLDLFDEENLFEVNLT